MTKWNIESMCGYKPITTFCNGLHFKEEVRPAKMA